MCKNANCSLWMQVLVPEEAVELQTSSNGCPSVDHSEHQSRKCRQNGCQSKMGDNIDVDDDIRRELEKARAQFKHTGGEIMLQCDTPFISQPMQLVY